MNSVPYVSQQRGSPIHPHLKFSMTIVTIITTRVMVCRYSCVEIRALPGSSQVVILIVVTLVNCY